MKPARLPVFIVFIAALLAGAAALAQPRVEVAWAFGDLGYASTPAVGDIDADGRPEIVYGTLIGSDPTSTGHLDAIRKRADDTVEPVFSVDIGGAVFSPAIGDIDKDGFGEVVVYAWSGASTGAPGVVLPGEIGHVVCVDHTGGVQWDTNVAAPPHRNGGSYNMWNDEAPALGDINGDGFVDVALYLGDYNVHVLDGLTGAILWVRPGGDNDAFYVGKTAILDLNQDGRNEVLSAGGLLKVYDSTGNLWWERSGNDLGVADLGTEVAGAIDPSALDGIPEVAASVWGGLNIYSFDGRLLTTYSAPQIGSGVAIADFDLDGVAEVAFGSTDGYVVMLNGDGSVGWNSGILGVGEWDNPDLTATDLNGDLAPEVTTISDDWGPLVLDGLTGALMVPALVSVNENEHSPAIADADGDKHAEIVFSGSYGGAATYPNTMLVVGDDSAWVDTRSVWNMSTYYVSNVEEDLGMNLHTRPWLIYNVWRCNRYLVECQATARISPAEIARCIDTTADFDAAGSELFNCSGGIEYQWVVDGITVIPYPGSPAYTHLVAADATIGVNVRCSTDPLCEATAEATLTAVDCPLAVTFAFYGARREGRCVRIAWGTATEIATLGFEVLALSPDGPEDCPTTVAFVPSQGAGSAYEVLDCPWERGELEPARYVIQEIAAAGEGARTPAIAIEDRSVVRSRDRRDQEGQTSSRVR